MSADDRHVGIHYQRIQKAGFLNGLLDFSYSLSPGFSFFRGLYAAGFRTLTGSTFNSAVFINQRERGRRSPVGFDREIYPAVTRFLLVIMIIL